jgi:sugar phosphate isomerase/epimerase
MKIGLSELAWDNTIDLNKLLVELVIYDISFVELIIPKHIDWDLVETTRLKDFLNTLNRFNINIESTQSVLFNSKVKSISDNSLFIDHMNTVFDICKKFSIKKIVLGAPSLRQNCDIEELVSAFKQLDLKLNNTDRVLLLEPNSRHYNGDYFFTVDEIVSFIKKNNFKNIKTMIDTHNIILENQSPSEIFTTYYDYIDHIHVSEINLDSFKPSNDHYELANKLKEFNYKGLVIYECKKSNTLIEDIKLFSNIYNK